MDRFFKSLGPFIRAVVRHSVVVLLIALLVSAAAFYEATHLRIDTDFSKLIPSDYPSVEALERLRATVGGESEVAVAVVSPSFEANKAFAEDFIPKALALKQENGEPYLTRVEYRRNTEFLQDNALYFATPAELDSLRDYLQAKVEDARLEANPFYFDLEDEEEEPASDSTAEALQNVYKEIVGKEYPVSDDSTTLVLRFYPSGSQTNIGFIDALYMDLNRLAADMQPASYHPQMEIKAAGRLLRTLVEVRAITGDVFSSFGAGVSTVLLIVVLYFFYKGYHARSRGRFSGRILLSELARTPVLALVIGLPLIMSLSWTFGLAYVVYETLNLMTSTLGLVLFGLGIDYGIHFYARYSEERGRGHGIAEAAEITFTSTGQAITVGALTTAAAMYILVIADFKGFSEFGFIAGTGILFALVSMLVVMPALIGLFERFRLLNLDVVHAGEDRAAIRGRRFPAARPIVIGSIAAVLAALVFVPRVQFEYEFGKLEPDYEAYDAMNRVIRRVFDSGGRRNPAYVVVDSPEEVPAVVAAVRKKAQEDTLSPTIREVESLQERFPLSTEGQQEKLARIAEIRQILEDPFLQAEASPELERLRRAAQTDAPIALSDVPDFLTKQFTSKSGEIGNFIMIYPSVGLSDGRESIRFSEDVGEIVTADGKVYHAGSTSLVAADMLRLMMGEAPWMILATFLIVCLLMYINFRSLKWAALALIPLLVGVLWMLLLMELFKVSLNFYNLVVLPAATTQACIWCIGTGRRASGRSGTYSVPPESTSRWPR